jgi:hypothetical protein
MVVCLPPPVPRNVMRNVMAEEKEYDNMILTARFISLFLD